MKKEYAKTLYAYLGTSQAPNPQREDFLSFVKNYTSAKEVVDFFESFKTSLIAIPEVSCFTYELVYESNDEGGTYSVVEIEEIEDSEGKRVLEKHPNYKSLRLKLADALSNIPEDLKHHLAYDSVSLKEIDSLRENAMSENEKEAYNMVEFFERDQLLDNIQCSKPAKEHKI